MDAEIKVFVVEKHSAVRHALAYRLAQERELVVVGHAEEPDAVATGDDNSPDVIVYGLPKRSERLWTTVRSTVERLASLAGVVVLTGHADVDEHEGLLAAGAAQILLMHIDTALLFDAIRNSVGVMPSVAAAL